MNNTLGPMLNKMIEAGAHRRRRGDRITKAWSTVFLCSFMDFGFPSVKDFKLMSAYSSAFMVLSLS